MTPVEPLPGVKSGQTPQHGRFHIEVPRTSTGNVGEGSVHPGLEGIVP
jgi:hypothetical protein